MRPQPISAVVSALLCTGAWAQQDACIALLQHGIYASHVTKTSTYTYQGFRSAFCSWYASYRQNHSTAGAEIQIPIADIPVGISGNMSYGEADALQKGVCKAVVGVAEDNKDLADAANFIDPNGAAAFRECVRASKGGFRVLSQINEDETLAVLTAVYQAPYGAGPATLNRVDVEGWTCPQPPAPTKDLRDLIGKKEQMGNAAFSISCRRDVTAPTDFGGEKIVAKAAMIAINSTAGTYTQFFPRKLAVEPLADTAKVLASYPKGTILPFAGAKANIPQGWHLCDGRDGTVDLTDRLPMGTADQAQIGKLDGQKDHDHTFASTTATFQGATNRDVKQDGGSPLSVPGLDHVHAYSGTTSRGSNLPPIAKVLFIQKIQ